jgi:hypothetical protein
MNIKRFLVRKILRKVYDPEEIIRIPFKDMNAAEMRVFVEAMYTKMIDMQGSIEKMRSYVAEIPAPCDKCYDDVDMYCFKCEGTGLVRNKSLCSWPWD